MHQLANRSTTVMGHLCGLLLMASAGCTGPAGADTNSSPASASPPDTSRPVVWRFAIEEAVGSVQDAYAREFKRIIEQETEHSVEVIIYPYGTLGTSTHITEQLNMGVLQFAMASPGSLGKFIPELQVFLLHFVLPASERDKQRLFRTPEVLQFFDALYAPQGLQLLSLFSEGEMVWTLKKQVRTPDEFQGLKMRVMTSPILLSAYAAYGASPTPMPYSEVYSGLQLNMIDGQVNPVFAIERQKFHEVTEWMIFPGHTSFVTTCAANRAFMQQLSPARRGLIRRTIDRLDEFIFQEQTRLQHERLKSILAEKQAKQVPFHIVGDMHAFLSTLTSEERLQLVESNDRVHWHPPLTAQERAAFRTASQRVNDVFLEIGGPQAEAALQLLSRLVDRPAKSTK